MTKLTTLAISSYLALTLVACESTGTIRGLSDGRSIDMEYQQGFQENDGQLKVTMQNGEVFTGKFVQKSSIKSGNAWDIGEASSDDNFILSDSTTVSSQAEAILIGNKGSTMKCKFELTDPESGIGGGGIGNCRTSKGKTISMTF
jgi:hypothetical protein